MDEKRSTIFVVEDDPELGPLIADLLSREGFEVSLAIDGADLDVAMDKAEPDLIVLDLMLPGEDGLSICRRLRAGGRVPIIMLTAKADEVDRIVGLEVGADDYLAKPFAPRELIARIRAVLRRTAEAPPERRPGLAFGPFRVDLAAMALERDGQEVRLTSGEFALLRAFVLHPGRVLSRDWLMENSHARSTDAFDRTVDVQVSRLRAKLGDDPKAPLLIKTVRNAGYVFTAPIRRT